MNDINNKLIDSFGRKIDYIRVSVTKNCNFRCKYCMPNTPPYIEETLIPLPKMLEFLKIAMDLGIKKIRLTGGEPLLRSDLSDFIKGIYDYKSGIEVALTTNGFLLEKYIKDLSKTGLKRINVSLDSLKKETIIKISKRDALDSILNGLNLTKEYGLKIKLNMVPLRGINDDEIIPMLDFALSEGYLLRYIEYMDNSFAFKGLKGFRGDELLKIISTKYSFKPIEKRHFGPANMYELLDSSKAFGIIAPHSHSFCEGCNRIRLTSDGIICPCLYFEDAIDISSAILNDDKVAMKEALIKAVFNKPEKNKWGENETSSRAFYHTGG